MTAVLGGRRFPLTVAGLALGALALVPAPPAGAFLRDFQAVESQSSPSTAPTKTVDSACPGGKVALGTGGSATPALPGLGVNLNGVGLQRLWPTSDLGPSTLVGAVAADPVPTRWRLSGQSYCASSTNLPPGTATGAPYVKALSVARRDSAHDSSSPKNVSAQCDGGKQAIGGGFASPNGAGRVTVRRAVRTADGFSVHAEETDRTGDSWGLTAVALCANLTRPGQSYVTDLSVHVRALSVASPEGTANSFSCPAGQQAVGGGAQLLGSNATVPAPVEAVLVKSMPAISNGIPTGWEAAAGEEDPTAGQWHLVIRAICAKVVTPTVSP